MWQRSPPSDDHNAPPSDDHNEVCMGFKGHRTPSYEQFSEHSCQINHSNALSELNVDNTRKIKFCTQNYDFICFVDDASACIRNACEHFVILHAAFCFLFQLNRVFYLILFIMRLFVRKNCLLIQLRQLCLGEI